MTTMRELLGLKPKNGDLGIEIEVEYVPGSPKLDAPLGSWAVKEDSSLVNGLEYYTRQPIPNNSAKLARIQALCDELNKPTYSILHGSPRTSVHVHCNIQDLTPVQLWTAIIAYWMLENPLMQYCDPELRSGNLFCLELKYAQGILRSCMKDLRRKSQPFRTFDLAQCKYGGQNLASIPRFGSVEYRGMRGTTDAVLIDEWTTVLSNIIKRSKGFRDPAHLMDFYFDSSKDSFLYALLDAQFIEKLKATPNYTGLIRENITMLCDLAYFHDDWQDWNTKVSNVKIPVPSYMVEEAQTATPPPAGNSLNAAWAQVQGGWIATPTNHIPTSQVTPISTIVNVDLFD